MVSRLLAGGAIVLALTAGGSAALAQQAPAGTSTSGANTRAAPANGPAHAPPAKDNSFRSQVGSAAGTVGSSGPLIAGTVGGGLGLAGRTIGGALGGFFHPKTRSPDR